MWGSQVHHVCGEEVPRQAQGIEIMIASTGYATDVGSYLDVDGIRTFYVDRGSGVPLVLVHGAAPGACTLVSWQPNLDPLAAAGFRVIAFDQPGFGLTDLPADHSLEYRVAHAKAFIDALGLERYHLVGNSVGAYVAARLALEDPRVDRLILISSSVLAPRGSAEADALAREHSAELRAFEPSLDSVRAMTMKTLFCPELVTEALVQARLEMSSGPRYQAQVARRSAAPQRPILDELPSLAPKTLILWGNNDKGAAVERSLLLFKLIPGAELHIFDQCGHWVQWDQAERFNALVADFLSTRP
jgi:pimeloyl-ACP methyl ester carboxylesterase